MLRLAVPKKIGQSWKRLTINSTVSLKPPTGDKMEQKVIRPRSTKDIAADQSQARVVNFEETNALSKF